MEGHEASSPGGDVMRELHDAVAAEVAKVVVGQRETVATLLAASALGGHVLLEGPPGVAKTLLANAVARALGVEFRRVQFTPDMLPSDLTGNVTLRGGRAGVPARPGVHQRAARRRGQPHPAEDPGRAARGDAGAAGVGRRPPGAAARPVPRRRDAEPARVRRHLRAARGAARPLPREAQRRLPVGGRGARDARAGAPRRRRRGPRRGPAGRRARTRCARRGRKSTPRASSRRSRATSSTSSAAPASCRASSSAPPRAPRSTCSAPRGRPRGWRVATT